MVNEKKQWKLMLNHFKKNPADLLDALPTPEKGSEKSKGFETGLTPNKGFNEFPLSAR